MQSSVLPVDRKVPLNVCVSIVVLMMHSTGANVGPELQAVGQGDHRGFMAESSFTGNPFKALLWCTQKRCGPKCYGRKKWSSYYEQCPNGKVYCGLYLVILVILHLLKSAPNFHVFNKLGWHCSIQLQMSNWATLSAVLYSGQYLAVRNHIIITS